MSPSLRSPHSLFKECRTLPVIGGYDVHSRSAYHSSWYALHVFLVRLSVVLILGCSSFISFQYVVDLYCVGGHVVRCSNANFRHPIVNSTSPEQFKQLAAHSHLHPPQLSSNNFHARITVSVNHRPHAGTSTIAMHLQCTCKENTFR